MKLEARTKDGVLMFTLLGAFAQSVLTSLLQDHKHFRVTSKKLKKEGDSIFTEYNVLVAKEFCYYTGYFAGTNILEIIFTKGDYIKILE